MLESSRDVIYRMNTQTGRFEYISPFAEKIVGFSIDELMVLDIQATLEMIHPDDRHIMQTALAHLEDTGEAHAEYRQQTKNGGYRWISNYMSITKDDAGKPLYHNGNIRDITERKKDDDALKSSQQMLESVLENFPGVVFWKDRNSVYLGCNRNFSSGAGLAEPSAIIGKNDFDKELPWKKEAEYYIADDLQVIESGIPKLNIIETLRQVDGRVAWFDTNKVPLRDSDGNVMGVLGTSNDITARKKAEEELRKSHDNLEIKVQERTAELDILVEELKCSNAELQQFAYVSSHDLQEPLRTIASFTQLLQRRYTGKFDSDADEFMEYIVEAAIRMKAQIEGLLEYSRVGTQGEKFEPVDMNLKLNYVIQNLNALIKESEC